MKQLQKGWCDYCTVVRKHGHGSLIPNMVFIPIAYPCLFCRMRIPMFFQTYMTILVLKISSCIFISFLSLPAFPRLRALNILLDNIYFHLYPSFLHSCTLTWEYILTAHIHFLCSDQQVLLFKYYSSCFSMSAASPYTVAFLVESVLTFLS